MSGITTHVLDTANGRPAAAVDVLLERRTADAWQVLSHRQTDSDGRVKDLLPGPVDPGLYRLTFDTGAWFKTQGTSGFFPQVTIAFDIRDGASHYHVPLLLSPYGYSTYRGS